VQHHTVQQLERGPRAGKWVYTGGNDRGRYVQCCADSMVEVLGVPQDERDAHPAWERIGHETREQAYAHMRERLLEKLQLEVSFGDWSGCRAPMGADRAMACDVPTKKGASIPPCHFSAPLCDKHRTRDVVERMWAGPGDWSGSW